MRRVQVRPAVLADAREHVLRCLPEGLSISEAERYATLFCADFLRRVRKGQYRRVIVDSDISVTLEPRWRTRLMEGLDPVSDVVFRMHYSDGHPLQVVKKYAAVDGTALTGARGLIRESARRVLAEGGMDLVEVSTRRLDLLISRIANQSQGRCPSPVGLLSEDGRSHADNCPPCSRAMRLIREGVLSPADLVPPENDGLISSDRIDLLAVLIHPDGRTHFSHVDAALVDCGVRVQEDGWLIRGDELATVGDRLSGLSEVNMPPRYHLRGAHVSGLGRWSHGVVLGALPIHALEAARARPWSEIDGLRELPPPLPPAPKAHRWWIVSACLGVLAVAAGYLALTGDGIQPTWPIEASFKIDDDTVEVQFDTGDLAVVDVVVDSGDALRIFAQSQYVEKGRWATGEGDYLLTLEANRVMVISSPEGIDGLDILVEAALIEAAPFDFLQKRIHELDPRSDTVVSPVQEQP